MNVLHVFDHSLPLHSGYSFRSLNILSSLRQAGVTSLAVTSPRHEASWHGAWQPEETLEGFRFFRTGKAGGPSLPFLSELRLMARLRQRIRQVAEAEKPLLIHAHSPVLDAFPALNVGRGLGLPVLYEIRAFWEDAAADHGTYAEGGLKYRLVQALETSACRRAQAVITICQGLKNELLARGIAPEKIFVVPNAVNPEEFSPRPPLAEDVQRWGLQGDLVVGFIGSFYRYEGLDLLLEAVALLRRELPAIKVLLAGGGPMEAELREQALTLGIAEQVIFTGRLPHQEIAAVYALCDMLVFPRHAMRLTNLVTPLKPLEAMAMEKAIIASDVGGHGELIKDGETGLLFAAGDAGTLARTIAGLARTPERRLALGKTGRQWVSTHRTWQKNGVAIRQIYEDLLSRKP